MWLGHKRTFDSIHGSFFKKKLPKISFFLHGCSKSRENEIVTDHLQDSIFFSRERYIDTVFIKVVNSICGNSQERRKTKVVVLRVAMYICRQVQGNQRVYVVHSTLVRPHKKYLIKKGLMIINHLPGNITNHPIILTYAHSSQPPLHIQTPSKINTHQHAIKENTPQYVKGV